MSNLSIARRFVAVGYSSRGLRHRFTTTTMRMVADDHDHDPNTLHHGSVNDVKSPDLVTPDRFVPWSQYSQLVSQVSGHVSDISMIKMQYEFLNKRFDGLENNIETATNRFDRRFELIGSDFNRKFDVIDTKFEAMDRKMTTWFLGLMGLYKVKGGFDFFSDKNRTGK